LLKWETNDIIEKVQYSEWATPIVVVKKKDNSLRICADFRYTVNPVLKNFEYKLPTIEELYFKLGKGNFFSKIDLSSAFLQVPSTQEASKILTINTCQGLYRFKRLPFGLTVSTAYFQKFMDEISQMEGVAYYVDDLIVVGTNYEEHQQKLKTVLNKMKEKGLTCNIDKCEFFKKNIIYLGHVISEEGLFPEQGKLELLKKFKVPNDKTELQAFLGFVNYYARFVENFTKNARPLYDLLKE